jgi:hypothetical protein
MDGALMKNVMRGLLAIALLSICVGASFADTHPASTCSRTDVGNAVNAASSGDTVTVPAGNCTWTTPLIITKGITLQGAGTGQTFITANLGYASVQYYAANRRTVDRELILYKPSSPSLDEPFRLTGFEFDLQCTSTTSGNYPLRVESTSSSDILTNIRIDNNKFKNVWYRTTDSGYGYDFEFINVRGVIDHNEFTVAAGFHIWGYPGGKTNWQNETFTPGTSNSLYFENNHFSLSYQNQPVGAGWGGRYVFRYNTVEYSSGSPSSWERPCDAHGNQSSNVWGSMGVEIYGNSYIGPSSISSFNFSVIRGGEALEFYNRATGMGNGSMHHIWEEYCDDVNGAPTTASDGQPLHVSDSYFWNNRGGSSGTSLNNPVLGDGGPECATFQPSHNSEWWSHNASFNGTSGMGCGTLGSRPATCTTGVGYWATNQSCTSVPSVNIGWQVSTPVSGTLYVCTSTDTWTSYYTPYTYPHPLVSTAAPASPTVVFIE